MAKKPLKPIKSSEVTIFKIANRRGYAAIVRNHLTEGGSPLEAYRRMIKACKRNGFALPEKSAGSLPKVK